RMLELGGNAVDAAVASAFTLAVVEPSMSGLGGRLQAIVHLPDGEIVGVDATTQIPDTYDYETAPKASYGYPVIGIPGVVAGLCKLWEEHGSLPLETLIQPAIHHASKGFALLPGEAFRHGLAAKEIGEFEGTKKYFQSSDGDPFKAGEILVQKDLAKTLKQIAKGGAKAFYEGAIAEKIVADHQAKGGFLTFEALANYEAKSSKIVDGSYRGYELHGLWMPSFGAITIQILQILESLPMDQYQGADWASAMAQAISLAYANREAQRTSDSMATVLTDSKYAQELSKQIVVKGKPIEVGKNLALPESWKAEMGHTTHLSTADNKGMMVALTQSLGPNMGSKVAAPGLGFLYATTIGKYLRMTEPGQRASSHISPFLITKEGKPFMALGAAGGSRIVTAITAVTSRVLDHKLPLDQALAAPRVYPDKDTLLMEVHPGPTWKEEELEQLEGYGFPIKQMKLPGRFGRVHAVQFDPVKGVWIGAADPDWEGAVDGPEGN
ncbi:MAG: gamma-glutamyltransferase, partial [Bacteroidota bacterium]